MEQTRLRRLDAHSHEEEYFVLSKPLLHIEPPPECIPRRFWTALFMCSTPIVIMQIPTRSKSPSTPMIELESKGSSTRVSSTFGSPCVLEQVLNDFAYATKTGETLSQIRSIIPLCNDDTSTAEM